MAAISINDVTTTLTNGNGVFDVLMRSIDAHLDKQYTSGRIKGSDYATVYMGALQAVLQQAIQFVLTEQKAEKEVDLLTEQIIKTQEEVDLLQSQDLDVIAGTATKNAQSAKDLLVKQEQIDASQANTTNKNTLTTKQAAVYDRQASTFDDDYKFKLFKTLLDIRTTGLTQGEKGIDGTKGDLLIDFMLADAGITGDYTALLVDPA